MNFFKEIINKIMNLNKIYKLILLVIFALILIIIFSIIWYNISLNAVSKESNKVKIEIPIGSSSSSIATILKDNNLIRNKLAFKIYIKINKVEGLKAGTYELDKNSNVSTILETLKTGKVIKNQVSITFVEGKNIRWIAQKIEENTNNTSQDVFALLEDEQYIESLIEDYDFISSEVKNKDIYYPLEGYLFPDTYYFEGKDVTVKEIFKSMLDKMNSVLSNIDTKNTSLSIHELLTLASIIELEGTDIPARKDIASVFYNRLNSNMSLGSDVTTYYAYNIDMGERDLTSSELYSYNPYNTRGPNMSGKLPVGPIASPSLSSIQAAATPNNTDYFYFVADKNKKVYFSRNISEHNAIITELKDKNLWFIYE